MSEWIKCSERLPEHSQKCRTIGSDGREFDCEYWDWHDGFGGYFKLIGSVFHHDNVTNWMPLPPAPEEE